MWSSEEIFGRGSDILSLFEGWVVTLAETVSEARRYSDVRLRSYLLC